MAEIGASALFTSGGSAGSGGPSSANFKADGGAPALSDQEIASRELADLKADAAFTKKYLAGDADAAAKMRGLHERVYAGNVDPATLDDRALDRIAEFANLSDGERDDIRHRRPVTPEAYKKAVQARARLLADAEWTRKYLAGDQTARRQMLLVTAMTCAPVSLTLGK